MTDQLKTITAQQCESPPAKYDDLSVLMLNCTLTSVSQPIAYRGIIENR
ncbi:MAG: hypothetical protein ACI9ON_002800 [Limisphaerales bacterium]|jgi:hypothetical protein